MHKLLTLAPLLLLLGGFLFLRPPLLGGATSYVIVSGRSMQPTLETGDLVLARTSPSYVVGDVVAYHPPGEEGLVIHRIVGREGEDFTFQGDNNDWVVPWTAPPDQIAGKGWVVIPRLGALFAYLQSPARMAAVVGALFLYVSLVGWALAPRWGSRERRRQLRMRTARRRGGLALWPSW